MLKHSEGPGAGPGGVEETDLFRGAGAPSGEGIVLGPVHPRSILKVPKNRQKENCQQLREVNRCGVPTLGS